MAAAVRLRADYSASDLRRLAKGSKDASQSRRLLSPAAIVEGWSREDAARVGGMDRQTLRDWVHRFNAFGPDGLLDRHGDGVEPRLSESQLSELAGIVEAGPDIEKDGIVRWRRIDLESVGVRRAGGRAQRRPPGKPSLAAPVGADGVSRSWRELIRTL